MNGRRAISRRKRFRFKALVLSLLGVVVLGAGGVWVYVKQRERNTEKLLAKAQDAVARSEWTEAATSYRQYLNRREDDVAALAAYADVLVTMSKDTPEQLGNAIRVLQRLLRAQPTNLKAIRELTLAYVTVGENTLAEDLAAQWVALEPNSSEAVLALATSRRGLRKTDSALEVLLAGIERMPAEPSLYPPIIALYTVELKNPAEGKAWLEKALQAAPNAPNIQLAAFAYLTTEGDFARAEEHLLKAIEAAPDDADVLLPAASHFTDRGNLDKARQLLDHVGLRAPDDHRRLLALSAWASKTRDTVIMREVAREIELKSGEKNLEALARAAELFLAAEDGEGADRCIALMEKAQSTAPAVQTWIAALRGARGVLDGRPHGAVAHLEEVILKEPNDERTLELLAKAYSDMGALEAAASAYRRLLTRDPDSVSTRLNLARLELQLGRDDAASGLLTGLAALTPREQAHAQLLQLASDIRRTMSASPSDVQIRALRKRLTDVTAQVPVDEGHVRLLTICLALAGYPADLDELYRARMADESTGAAFTAEYGGYLLLARRHDEVAKLLESLPDDPRLQERTRNLRVRWLAAQGKVDEARQLIAPLPDDPTKGELFASLADQCLAAGKPAEARDAFKSAAGLLTQNIPIQQQLRRLAESREDALAAAEAIRAIEGESAVTWRYERAVALLQFGPHPEAAREAEALLVYAVERRKEWPPAHVALGNAREQIGDRAGAAHAYQTALNQQPDLIATGTGLRLVTVLNQLGRFVEADVLLARVVTAAPDSADALALLIQKHVRANELTQAVSAAQKLLAARPDDAAVAALVADLMLQQGDVAGADEVVTRALARTPDDVPLQWSQVRVHLGLRRHDEAKALALRLATQHPSAKNLWYLAQVHEQLGESEAAEDAVRRALELAPDDVQLLAGVSEFWRLRGDRSKQLDAARRAVAARNDDPQAVLALAELLSATEASPAERAEAAQLVSKRLAEAPDDARALALDALLAGLREPPDLELAARQLQRAIELQPRLPRAHQLLTAVHIRRGNMKAAQEAVAQGLNLFPDNIDLLLASAEVAGYRGDYDHAMLILRRALDLRPRFTPALRMLPLAAERAGDVDRAIKIIESAAGGAPNAEESVALARLYEVRHDGDKAESLYLAASQAAPADSSVFQSLLQYYMRQSAFDKIRDLAEQRKSEHPDDVASLLAAAHMLGLQKADAALRDLGIRWLVGIASDHPPLSADALYRAGICYLQSGDTAQAESAFLQAAQAAPTAAEPVNALAWLYSEELDRPADALNTLEKFLAAGGRETPQMLDTHGAVLLRLGKLDAARAKLLACVEAAGQTETLTAATFHLGKLLHQQGRSADAVEQLRRAVELDKKFGGLSERERLTAAQMVAENPPTATP